VDDDPDILAFIRMALESEGHDVRTARNGLAALNQLREALPALILLDINMPIMDGVTFAHKAREEFGELRIIVMSAGTEMARFRREVGATDSLRKPFELMDLLDKVNHFVAA